MSDAIDWTLYAQLSDIVYDRGVGNKPIATAAVYGTFAHSRAAMDVIVSGAEIRNSQAWQQASTMAS